MPTSFHMTSITILGISPGTRCVGLALLKNGELSKWQVKTYKGSTTPEKLHATLEHIEEIIAAHLVQCVACKVPHPGRSSQQLEEIIKQVKEIAAKYAIECKIYSIEDLRSFFKMKFENKYMLAENVTAAFPQLAPLLLRERRNKHRYHIRTFEAIAAGMHCHHALCISKMN